MKRPLLLAFLLLAWCAPLQAQLLQKVLGKDNKLIERAVRQTCFLLRQDYVLEDSAGNIYGNGTDPYFGRTYGVAASAGGRLWSEARVANAWIADVNYTQYKDKWGASVSASALRRLDADSVSAYGGVWEPEIQGELAMGPLEQRPGTSYYQQVANQLPDAGMLAVFYAEPGDSLDRGDIKLSLVDVEGLVWKDGMAEEKQVNLAGKLVLGGALFKEVVTPGKVELTLVALYVRHLNDWVLRPINAAPAVVPKPLTPVGKAPEAEAEKGKGKKKRP